MEHENAILSKFAKIFMEICLDKPIDYSFNDFFQGNCCNFTMMIWKHIPGWNITKRTNVDDIVFNHTKYNFG